MRHNSPSEEMPGVDSDDLSGAAVLYLKHIKRLLRCLVVLRKKAVKAVIHLGGYSYFDLNHGSMGRGCQASDGPADRLLY